MQPPEKATREPEYLSQSWISLSAQRAQEWKQAMGIFATTHYIHYGMTMQVGSGTTMNVLTDEIIARQRATRMPLDLNILTSNLQVLARVQEAKVSDPGGSGFTDVILAGGELNASLDCLVGDTTVKAICSEDMFPNIVFMGAGGLTFENGDLELAFQFRDELSTLHAFATRPTDHRVILCDHTKLGLKYGFKATSITCRAALEHTRKLTILTTCPDDSDDAQGYAAAKVAVEESAFNKMIADINSRGMYDDKDVVLTILGIDGAVRREMSLQGLRRADH